MKIRQLWSGSNVLVAAPSPEPLSLPQKWPVQLLGQLILQGCQNHPKAQGQRLDRHHLQKQLVSFKYVQCRLKSCLQPPKRPLLQVIEGAQFSKITNKKCLYKVFISVLWACGL